MSSKSSVLPVPDYARVYTSTNRITKVGFLTVRRRYAFTLYKPLIIEPVLDMRSIQGTVGGVYLGTHQHSAYVLDGVNRLNEHRAALRRYKKYEDYGLKEERLYTNVGCRMKVIYLWYVIRVFVKKRLLIRGMQLGHAYSLNAICHILW